MHVDRRHLRIGAGRQTFEAFRQRLAFVLDAKRLYAFKMLRLASEYSPEDRLPLFCSSRAIALRACAAVVDRDRHASTGARTCCSGGALRSRRDRLHRARFRTFIGPSACTPLCQGRFDRLVFHRFRLLVGAVHLRDDFARPCVPRIAAPKRPRDPAVRGEAFFARTGSFCHFVDLVSVKERLHAPHGGRGKTRAVCYVPSSRDAYRRAATTKLASPFQSALGLFLYLWAARSRYGDTLPDRLPLQSRRSCLPCIHPSDAAAPKSRFRRPVREPFSRCQSFELPPPSIRAMLTGIDGAALERFRPPRMARWKDNRMRDEISARRACDFIP